MNSFVHRLSQRRTAYKQRGAAAVTLMLLMLGLVAMLGLVEVGYIFWVKRDLQKDADLAALAGAQLLDPNISDGGCADAISIAEANLGQNNYSGFKPLIECR